MPTLAELRALNEQNIQIRAMINTIRDKCEDYEPVEGLPIFDGFQAYEANEGVDVPFLVCEEDSGFQLYEEDEGVNVPYMVMEPDGQEAMISSLQKQLEDQKKIISSLLDNNADLGNRVVRTYDTIDRMDHAIITLRNALENRQQQGYGPGPEVPEGARISLPLRF